MTTYAIDVARAADAGELLTLQRAAYVTEAQLYDDVRLPALTQTLEELRDELSSSVAYKATAGGRMIGGLRARCEGSTFHIGRITVAPDRQGQGIGTALLQHAEDSAGSDITDFALFTGHLSEPNLRLYARHGYRETHREQLSADVVLVHMSKPR